MRRIFKNKLLASLLVLSCLPFVGKATDWSYVVNLSGSWYFSVGDDMNWANPKTDVSNWDKIYVPGDWEEYYKGYNGYAWYRKNFDIHSYPSGSQLSLLLGKVDDVDEVFINGVKVGQTGGFFPVYHSAWDVYRKYSIPDGLLKKEGNVIAVRVYDEGLTGGIVGGDKIGICYDNDNSLLEYDLSGQWKFSIYREPRITDYDFDDSSWETISVPKYWESQGHPDHDGYAWYRKKFSLNKSQISDDLYLAVGKIDDFDKVYLNGKLIGRTEDLDAYDRFTRSESWRMYRVYRIPEGLLQANNILMVEVYDSHGDGGIYEGPVGLMSRKNAYILEDRNENATWPNSVRSILHSIFNW